jgi:hypothetical protein
MSAQAARNVPERFAVEIRVTIVGKRAPVGYYNLSVDAQSASVDGKPTPLVASLRTVAFHPKFMPLSISFEGQLSALDTSRK